MEKMLTSSLLNVAVLGVVVLLASSTDAGCPGLFTEYNMACYYIGTAPVNTATDAFNTCYSLGGYLININAELENNYTMDEIANQQIKFDGYWIGGYYNGQYWMWQKIDSNTGQEVNEFMNPEAGYYRWGPYQPDDGLDPLFGQYYVAIMVRERAVPYSWYSENKDVRTPRGMSYICEADWKE